MAVTVKEKKEGRCWACAGLCLLHARVREKWAQPSREGERALQPFCLFFVWKISSFCKQQTNISFELELQKVSNKFLKFCKNKLYTLIDKPHLVLLINKIIGQEFFIKG